MHQQKQTNFYVEITATVVIQKKKKMNIYRKTALTATWLLTGLTTAFADNIQTDTTAVKTDTLSDVVVTATRQKMLRDALPVAVTVVGRTTIQQSDQNALMPVLMDQVPGLFVTSRGVTGYGVSNGAAGSISLRGFGAASGRVLILIDGHPQFESIYGHPVSDEYIASNAQRVEVARGASSVLYGSNAMGGAINIITRKPIYDGNALDIRLMVGSYGTLRGNISDNYKQGKFTATANINYDRTDGHRPNSAFHSFSGLTKMGYQLSDAWNFGANLSLMDAYSENPGTEAKPMVEGSAHMIRGMAGISFENRYDRTNGNIDLYYNWGNHIIDDGYYAGGKPQEFLFHGTDYTAGLSAFQLLNILTGNTLTMGADLMCYGGNAYRNPTTEIYADHKKLHEEAFYLTDQQQLGRFMFNAGIRIDHHSAYGMQYVPQVGISYMPSRNTTLKASVSKGFRMPNMKELYMYAVANEDLLPEEAWSYDFTIGQHLLDGALNLEASLFYTKGSNIIEVNVVDGKRQYRNVGEFKNHGIELSADYRVASTLSLNANYSYLHMNTIYTGAPRHKAYAGAHWNPGKFSFVLGAMAIEGLYLTTGEDAKTEHYVNLKARAGYQLCRELQLFVRGENLLCKRYYTMDGFPEAGATFMGGVSMTV